MKMYLVFFICIGLRASAQVLESDGINILEVIDAYNGFKYESKIIVDNSKAYSSFNFQEFSPNIIIEEGKEKYTDRYYLYAEDNNGHIVISLFNKKLNFENYEFIAKDFDAFKLVYALSYLPCNDSSYAIEHKCGKMISGFFIQIKNSREVFFCGTRNSKQTQAQIELKDIYVIMQLDENLIPQTSFNFSSGNLIYRSEFIYGQDDLKEQVYQYITVESDSFCKTPFPIHNVEFTRLSRLLSAKYFCPVGFQATVAPIIPSEKGRSVPVWYTNGYTYE